MRTFVFVYKMIYNLLTWDIDMKRQELLEQIEQADMVLVGLGEEFDGKKELLKNSHYVIGCERIKEAEMHSFLPAWNMFCAGKVGDTSVEIALRKLADLLKDKNYFIVSTAMNNEIACLSWKNERYVMPCGNTLKKQCSKQCEEIIAINDEDTDKIRTFFEKLYAEGKVEEKHSLLGNCPLCNEPYVFNNINVENYNENGYMDSWTIYKKWLQGTINRKLLILELGVGMKFPSVIRWPFEKVAFYNQKSYFCRINERLYQLTPELSGKGCGISQNAIEWLSGL